jgi:hypothetical protein
MKTPLIINQLSSHIFWDVDMNTLDNEKHAVFIVRRVIEYGLLKDWQLIKSSFGTEQLKKIILQIPSLDPVSTSFVSNLFQIEKSELTCYKNKQLNRNFWSY